MNYELLFSLYPVRGILFSALLTFSPSHLLLLSPLTAGKEFHCVFMTFGGRLKKGRANGGINQFTRNFWEIVIDFD